MALGDHPSSPGSHPGADPIAEGNAAVWSQADQVGALATRDLRPVEVMILLRYAADLSGRVLELGSGAGRLTGYLAEIAQEVRGLELAEPMIAYSRRRYPAATFDQGDLRDLSRYAPGSFGAVVASFNVLDVLGDAERRRVLAEIRGVLADDGLFVLSTHNRDAIASVAPPTRVRREDPLRLAADIVRLPRRVRNHRRLAGAEEQHPGYAIVNDSALDYSLLHYYISPAEQERQLAEQGFEPIECLDLDGRPVAPGADSSHSHELHYLARARRAA